MGEYVNVPDVRPYEQPTWVLNVQNQASAAIHAAESTLMSIASAGNEFDGRITALTEQITNIKIPPPPEMPKPGTPPGVGDLNVDVPAPGHYDAEFRDVPDVGDTTPPEFNAVHPVLNLQAVPAIPDAVMPAEPVLDVWELPAAPDVDSLAAPVLAQIVLPAVPQVTIPLFSTMRPGAPAVSVDDMVLRYEAADYVSPWLDKIQSEVVFGLQNGTGLSPANEAAIFGRARDRAATEQRKAEQAALTQFASRGFALPSGPLMAALEAARQTGADGVNEVSREVAVKRAEWEIEHYRFLLGKLGDFEAMSQQFWLGQQRMLLDAAQAVLQSKVQTYNVLASLYQAEIDAYRADTDVYKSQIEAEVQRLRIYESQIAGAKAQAELNQQEVAVYAEQQKALALHVELYKTRVEALSALEQRNLARIGAFKAQVEAAGAMMSAQATRAQAIATSNQAQAVQLQAYQADVGAYGERVRAFATSVEAKVSHAKLVTERNQTELARYQAAIEADKARIQGYVAKAGVAIDKYRANVENMRATADIAGRTAEVFVRGAEVTLNHTARSAEVLSKATEAAANTAVAHAKLAQDKAISTGQVYASLAASAFGAVHANWQSQQSVHYQAQLSEQHNILHKS